MWPLTDREVEFLASLRISWSRLYLNELARLLKEDDRQRQDGQVTSPRQS